MKKYFLLLCLFSSFSFAGPYKIGNGGGGILQGDKVYLLDLVEAGQEEAPYFDTSMANLFLSRIEKKLNPLQFPTQLISQKISEIYFRNKILGLASLELLHQIQWRFLNYDLEKTGDLLPIIEIDPSQIVQLANRRFSQISISKKYWQKMPAEHQAALIIHELLYCLMKQPYLSDNEISILLRTYVGLIFSPDISNNTTPEFNKLLGALPGLHYLLDVNIPAEWSENNYWTSDYSQVDTLSKVLLTPVATVTGLFSNSERLPIIFSSDKTLRLDEIKSIICSGKKEDNEIVITAYSFNLDFNTDSAFVQTSMQRNVLAHIGVNKQNLCVKNNEDELQSLILSSLRQF